MFSTIIVDNRVLGTGSFISEVARSTIQACTLSLIGRYIMLSENHSWLPRCSICYAAAADSIQEIKTTVDASMIPHLAKILEPKFTCYGVASSRASWNYMCSGLEHYLRSLTTQSRNIKQRRTEDKPLNFMLCFVTSDKALLLSAQDRNIAAGQGDTTYKERMRFRKLCSQISTTISDMFGPRAHLIIRVACAMVTRLPAGDANVILFNQMQLQPDIENEISKVRSELVTLHDTQHSNLNIVFSAFLPSPLMFQEQLRHIIDAHAPVHAAILKLPPFEDKLCALNVQVMANTVQGADALHNYFEQVATSPAATQPSRAELGDIYCFSPRAKMPSSYLAGPSLCLTAAELTAGGKEAPWRGNRIAFAALAAALIQTDALLILRVVQKSGEASYWAVIPPAHDVVLGVNMTLLKLVDQESMLIAGDTQFVVSDDCALRDDIKDASLVDGSNYASSDNQDNLLQRNFHMDGLDSKDERAFNDTVAYLRGALLSNFGPPVPFNPLCCCTEGLDLALNRYCSTTESTTSTTSASANSTGNSNGNGNGKRLRSPRDDTQELRSEYSGAGKNEVQFVEQGFYASALHEQSRSASIAKAGKSTATSSPSMQKGRPAAKAKAEHTPQPESSDDLSVTSNSSNDSSDFQEIVATRTRAARATLATKSNSRTAGHSAASASKSSVGSAGGRLRRADGTRIASVSTHAFTQQDPIEQWDEVGDVLVRGSVKDMGRDERGAEEEPHMIA